MMKAKSETSNYDPVSARPKRNARPVTTTSFAGYCKGIVHKSSRVGFQGRLATATALTVASLLLRTVAAAAAAAAATIDSGDHASRLLYVVTDLQ